jgi:hypothetical protein
LQLVRFNAALALMVLHPIDAGAGPVDGAQFMARRKSTSAADGNLLLLRSCEALVDECVKTRGESAAWKQIAKHYMKKHFGRKRATPRKTERDDVIVHLHRHYGKSFGQIALLSRKPLWTETFGKPIKAKTAEKACNRRLKQLATAQMAVA